MVDAVPTQMLGYAARRPRYAALGSERGPIMPSLDDALRRYLQDTTLEGVDAERRRAALQMASRLSGATVAPPHAVSYGDEATHAPAELYPPDRRRAS